MSDNITFSKKNKRQLSEFIAQEMLYDYLEKKLDPERHKAIEEILSVSSKCQEALENLNAGAAYVQELSHTELSQPLLEKIKARTEIKKHVMSFVRFSSLSPALKLGVEVTISAIIVAVLVFAIPWESFFSKQHRDGSVTYIIAEVEHQKSVEPSEEMPATPPPTVQTPTPTTNAITATEPVPQPIPNKPGFFAQISAYIKNKFTSPHVPTVDSVPVSTEPQPETIATAATPVPAQQSPVPTPTPTITTTTVATTQTDTTNTNANPVAKPGEGALFRVYMTSEQVNSLTPQIVDLITSLGGEKAGSVKLGWPREGGSYFHFTIPEANYNKLIEQLKHFGPTTIKKEKHPRVMPSGTLRLILWLEEESDESGSIPRE